MSAKPGCALATPVVVGNGLARDIGGIDDVGSGGDVATLPGKTCLPDGWMLERPVGSDANAVAAEDEDHSVLFEEDVVSGKPEGGWIDRRPLCEQFAGAPDASWFERYRYRQQIVLPAAAE